MYSFLLIYSSLKDPVLTDLVENHFDEKKMFLSPHLRQATVFYVTYFCNYFDFEK